MKHEVELVGVIDYISKDSKTYAKRILSRITKAAGNLRRFPHLGAVVEEWSRDDLREILVGSYSILYRVGSADILILGVIHGARRLPNAESLVEPESERLPFWLARYFTRKRRTRDY